VGSTGFSTVVVVVTEFSTVSSLSVSDCAAAASAR